MVWNVRLPIRFKLRQLLLPSHMTTELLISNGLQCICTCTKIERPTPQDWTAIDGAINGAITRAMEDQQGAIREFVLGRDVFVGLLTSLFAMLHCPL